MTHLDKKSITILITCTVLGGIVGGIVGSMMTGSRGENFGYRNGRGMMGQVRNGNHQINTSQRIIPQGSQEGQPQASGTPAQN